MDKAYIVYATKHGSTEECARILASKLSAGADLCNLKETKQVSLEGYQKIIIGGSIYAGRIQKEIKEFCIANEKELLSKKIGLFICSMSEGEEADKLIQASYPSGLVKSAVTQGNFGGKFDFGKMNFIERAIVKKVANVSSDQSSVSEDRIHQFARIMNEA